MNKISDSNSRVTAQDRPMRLAARDTEDLAVISACLQDALVPLGDFEYDPTGRSFYGVVNRFRWEKPPEDAAVSGSGSSAAGTDAEEGVPEAAFERVHCGLRIDGVERVQRRGFGPDAASRPQNLLGMAADDAGGAITLTFGGGGEIRLEISEISIQISDLGEPWATAWRPDHEASA